MSVRALLWLFALAAFILAAILHYSPRLSRHAVPLLAGGLAFFTAGWLTNADLVND